MVDICEEHASNNDLLFSTDLNPEKSKTIALAFNCKNKNRLESLYLCGDPLPWKPMAKHIGNLLSENGSMKRLCVYNAHFTGSPTWNFESEIFDQLCNSWNVNTRVIFGLPMQTHCWLTECLMEGNHAKKNNLL